MGLAEATLSSWKGQTVVVVTSDHRTFRGILTDVDANALLMDDAVEGTTSNTDAWTEVRMGDGVANKVAGLHGTTVFQRPGGQHQYRLTRVLILRENLHRVWQVKEARPLPKAPVEE